MQKAIALFGGVEARKLAATVGSLVAKGEGVVKRRKRKRRGRRVGRE